MRVKHSGHGGEELEPPVDHVLAMSTEELSRTWRNVVGKPAPANLPKSLSARLLAYQLQVVQHGDLAKEAIRLLETIADDLAAGKSPDIKPPFERRLKPGTVLIREHQGVQHRVLVMEEGYAWQGCTYASLSSTAKAITGTNWNGNTFFGLGEKKAAVRAPAGNVFP
jgi:hypothetical protein